MIVKQQTHKQALASRRPVILGGFPANNIEVVRDRLNADMAYPEAKLLAEAEARLVSVGDTADASILAMKADHGEGLAFIMPDPVRYLARSVRDGMTFQSSARTWIDLAAPLVKLAEEHSVPVFEYDAIIVDPAPLAKMTGNSFDTEMCGLDIVELPVDRVALYLASQYVAASLGISDLVERLSQLDGWNNGSHDFEIDAEGALRDYMRLAGEARLMFEQLHDLQLDLERNRIQMEKSHAAAKSLQDRLHGVMQSTSWRLTWPVRRVISFLRRLFR